ncbi:PHB depolymerase family esterase [Vitiosangium sp. GDMCC 1.1324]|uniref:extracellular catalytic domain type 1 short-chain-length polyhydroxyalkanoate depolymerase n=1 Tax=Vitiosangium sp. (strain GDMCC 1.1324) TaxID=2138576 RepID=UPI000D3DB19B|nr:PHB depolymerase family esterase [Vitiosangium sp. GDMCC 1.1324]PTL83698.1 PHB depolymerase esterase [Vitiosangium sp. GDMCC 1.1324]
MKRSPGAFGRTGALLLVLFALLSGAPAHAGSWVYGSYTNLWGTRGFQLWVPTGYQAGESLPLVVALHGCFQNPDQFAGLTRLNQKADAEKFLVLYPNQATLFNGTQCWNFMIAANQERGIGEPSIVVGMVDWVKSRYAVDSHRVYVGGVSAGAVMSSILLACYSDVFAAGMVGAGAMYKAATTASGSAFAMVFGSIYNPDDRGRDAWACSGKPRWQVPVLVLHGTEDDVVNPINGEQVVQQFLQTNDYGDDGTNNNSVPYASTRVWYGSVPGGRSYTVKDYVYGGRLLVQKYEMQGMGHAWPGGDPSYLFADPSGPDATTLMWDFFKQHTR